DEVHRPVQGIHDPASSGRGGGGRELLRDERVLREGGGQVGLDRPLRGLVHERDQVRPPLLPHLVRARAAAENLRRLLRGAPGGRQLARPVFLRESRLLHPPTSVTEFARGLPRAARRGSPAPDGGWKGSPQFPAYTGE